jgi:hypothetical protein
MPAREVAALRRARSPRAVSFQCLRARPPRTGRVGEPGEDEAFFLEAGEGGVDGADGDVVAGAAFDFLADGDAVGVLPEVEEGEHDEELELAEAVFRHGTAGKREAGVNLRER